MSDTPERIAKVLARRGVASRREVERMIADGRVSLNGKLLDTPAVTVTDADKILVDRKPVPVAERMRIWKYHKPTGLVTTARDEKGRKTIFDDLPDGMPNVMSIGRLDLNSEGLLLLTNDGGVKRHLELPSTGWKRRYRVRVRGTVQDAALEHLRKGMTVEGVHYQPMDVSLDSQSKSNAWLTIGLREGKNREIRKACAAIGLEVNRLIRISYGPFQLDDLEKSGVVEIPQKLLSDQIGKVVSPTEKKTPPQRTKRTRERPTSKR